MALKTYDPKLVILTVGGVPISGFADGTFISAMRSNDSFTKVSGADGIVTRAKSNDKSGEITITLQQSSPSNDVLNGFAQLDERANAGIVPVTIKELNGTTLLFGAEAWVRKPADTEYGKEVSNREWTIDVAELEYNIGGIIA